jgi:hypothetical protein
MPGNRLPRIDLEWKLEGAIRKGGDKEMDIVKQNTANHGLTEDTREKGRWKNLVLGEGKPRHNGQSLD